MEGPGSWLEASEVGLGPEGTGRTWVSERVKAGEWGPRCSPEGTLREALVSEGTGGFTAGRKGLDGGSSRRGGS